MIGLKQNVSILGTLSNEMREVKPILVANNLTFVSIEKYENCKENKSYVTLNFSCFESFQFH